MENIIQSVKREIFIKTTPEKAWKALTITEERNKWETRNCELDIRIGGKVSLDYGWGVSYVGTVTELEEERRLVLQGEDKEYTIWTIHPQADGVIVSIEYTGTWIGDIGLMEMENMLFGTYQFMLNMKSVLEEGNDSRNSFWSSWIGILHRTDDNKNGSKIVKVTPNTPSENVLAVGDIVVSVDNKKVTCYDDLEKYVSELEVGTDISLSFLRSGTLHSINLSTIAFGTSFN